MGDVIISIPNIISNILFNNKIKGQDQGATLLLIHNIYTEINIESSMNRTVRQGGMRPAYILFFLVS